MSNQWVLRGITSRVRTERLSRPEDAPHLLSGLPELRRELRAGEAAALAAMCPTGALMADGEHVVVRRERCVRCGRCTEGDDPVVTMQPDGDAVRWRDAARPLPAAMRRSLHIRVLDAGGDCGACLNEVRQLNSPLYSMHRLGFFVTPTPRHADVLLVVGSVTEHMRAAVEKVYAALPDPSRVIAVGHCAITGGLWHGTLTGGVPVANLMPVDIEVLGAPPAPRVILDALLLATGRITTRSGAHGESP